MICNCVLRFIVTLVLYRVEPPAMRARFCTAIEIDSRDPSAGGFEFVPVTLEVHVAAIFFRPAPLFALREDLEKNITPFEGGRQVRSGGRNWFERFRNEALFHEDSGSTMTIGSVTGFSIIVRGSG